MRRGRSLLVVCLCLAIMSIGAQVGCSLLLDEDFAGPTAPGDGGSQSDDGGDEPRSEDGGLRGDTSSARNDAADGGAVEDDGGPNILVNPSFEQGGACVGWLSEYGSMTDSDLARNGSHGCLVCTIATNQEVQFYQIMKRPITTDEAFNAEVWIRSDTRTAPAPLSANTYLEVDFRSDAGIDRGPEIQPTKAITEDWQPIIAASTSRGSGEAVQIFLHFTSPDSARVCVVVDTARAYKTN